MPSVYNLPAILNWNATADATSLPPGTLTTAENVDYDGAGTRKRGGTTSLTSTKLGTKIYGLGYFSYDNTNQYRITVANSAIYYWKTSTSTWEDITAALTITTSSLPANKARFQAAGTSGTGKSELYMCNGTNGLFKITGSTPA